ncbi:sarcosine oxidase subunit delta [Neorhizobium galegae]|uniref:sarcosine oxidase subunit delta n=1 Tax=Neorhizobium galegae TaxID=399 RepID=UPI001AE1BDBC|nr:sarcosine oxidase subunit delta [Neorhizobium galegae]MBP2548686.1 sarcosine oxidase subunit delta [Neorhizobium galegae]
MASLITCPHCGSRPKEEFSIRGDALPQRPAAHAPDEAWHAYVYLRDNVKGVIFEHWHHVGGCRRYLVVERDNVSHDVLSVTDAARFRRAAASGQDGVVAAGKDLA